MKILSNRKTRVLHGSAMLEAVEYKAHSSVHFHSVKFVVVHELMGKNKRTIGIFSTHPDQHPKKHQAQDFHVFGAAYPDLADRLAADLPYLPSFNQID